LIDFQVTAQKDKDIAVSTFCNKIQKNETVSFVSMEQKD
jgi:hypothetical protein